MFELAGTHFNKGIFQLDLERAPSPLMARILRLGALRGRFVVLAMIAAGSFLAYTHQPRRWLLGHGYTNFLSSLAMQKGLEWALVGVAGVLWLFIVLRRPEKLELVFDRSKGEFRFSHVPGGRHSTPQEGAFPFSVITAIRVFGPEREPKTPHGFIEVALGGDLPDPYKAFRFKLLSDEQFQFYPANLSRMTGKAAEGDWKDPDDQPVGS